MPSHTTPHQPNSLQYSRPRLKAGQIFGSLVSTDRDASLLFELGDGSRQVSLPGEASHILPLLDGSRTIPDILDELHKSYGRVSFKFFFGALQKLQTLGCLDGTELLADEGARARLEMFERERSWITRPILSFRIAPGKILGEPSALAFVLFSLGTLIVTLSFLFGALALGFVEIPTGFLLLDESYVKGILFFFAAASVLVTAKTVVKTILSLLLTGARSRLNLELSLFTFALRSQDDKIYVAGGTLLGTLAFAAIASSYFFIFAIASAVAPHWSRLDDLFWISAILALVDLNPFRKSDLSSFFHLVYNRRSMPELLPYFRNRGFLFLKTLPHGTAVYTAYSALSIAWMMFAYNILLSLGTRNDSILFTTFLQTWREGAVPELLAILILAGSLLASFFYLTVDLVRILARNALNPSRSRRFVKKQSRKMTPDVLQNAEILASSMAKLPLFSKLHLDAVLFLLSKSQTRKVQKGAYIAVQGTTSRELFILLDGEVKIQKRHATGAAQDITSLKELGVFGESTLLAGAPRSADAIATKDSRVIAIPRKAIDELIQHPTFRTEAETLLDRLILGQYAASSELFRHIPGEAMSLFFNEGEVISFATGRHVIEQGRRDNDFYLLIRGSVDVVHDGQIVGHLQQGDFFGEMSLIQNAPRPATIMTREPCRLLKITSRQFWNVLSQNTSVALYLESPPPPPNGDVAS